MKKRYIEIITDEQIQNCINSSALVEVWVQNEFDKINQIISCNKDVLKIGEEYYFKSQCKIIAMGNYFK